MNITYGQDTITADNVIMMSEKDTFFFPVNKETGVRFTGVIIVDESQFHITYSTYKEGVLLETITRKKITLNKDHQTIVVDTLRKEDRDCIENDEFGRPIAVGKCKNEKKEGAWVYYQGGKKTEVGFYDRGHKTGLWECYTRQGILQKVNYFKEGNIVFSKKVKIKKRNKFSGEIDFIENDSITRTFVYDEDVLILIRFKNNGQIIQEQEYVGLTNKTGKYLEKDIKGNLLITGKYLSGYRDGFWSFYKNGVKIMLGSYYFGGLKSGIWKNFSDKGELEKIEFFKSDRVSKIERFENGKSVSIEYID